MTPAMENFLERLTSWRSMSHQEQLARMGVLAPDRPPEPEGGRIRVGIFCPCLLRGGAETWQHCLAKSVDTSQVAWQGCCVVDGTGLAHPETLQVMNQFMPVSAGHEAARDLATRCDVILSWTERDYTGRITSKEKKPKVVFVVHLPPAGYMGCSIDHSAIDHYVAVSTLATEIIPEHARHNSPVILNAVDPARLEVKRSREAVRDSWGIPGGCHVAGFLSRLSPEKDPDAARRLVSSIHPGWHVVLVGDGKLFESLSRNPNPRLHVVGGDSDVGSVLNAFDVLIAPSLFETFGLTIAEGLYSGVPVVSTKTGIASIYPQFFHEIPTNARGRVLSQVTLEAYEHGPKEGSRQWARENLSIDRFGREWTNYLVDIGRKSRVSKVAKCLHRGGVLPISMQPDCGCKGKELSECKKGLGSTPGRVTLQECIECVGVGNQHD